ncbi:MAG: phosphatase PAP2 family protein [Butyrivibrio sp.]
MIPTWDWELSLLHWFQSIHNPALDVIMKSFTFLGNIGLIWILLALVLLFIPKYRQCGVSMAFSLILSLIFTNLVIKNIVARPRPFTVDPTLLECFHVKQPTDWSFPSGHSAASFAASVAFFCNKGRKKVGAALMVLAALISVSRLYLSVHFPTDVIAGIILGVIYGVAGAFIAQKTIFRPKKEAVK